MQVPIFYSPSAQEHNQGAVDYGVEETRMNEIADIGIPDLERNGFTVFRNRRTDTLDQIIAHSNQMIGYYGLHVAVHSNATGVPGALRRGTTVYYYTGSAQGMRLAQCIYDELSAVTPVPDNNIVASDYYGELRRTHSPSVIIEVDFHDNPEGAEWIMTHEIGIAYAINKGICNYCNIEYKEATNQMRGIIVLFGLGDLPAGMRLMRKTGYPIVTIENVTGDELHAIKKIQVGGSTPFSPDAVLLSGTNADETDDKVTDYLKTL